MHWFLVLFWELKDFFFFFFLETRIKDFLEIFPVVVLYRKFYFE